MNARWLLVLFLAPLAAVLGCSQPGTPVPSGTESLAVEEAARVSPGSPPIEYYDTPTQVSWPVHITNGPLNSRWFGEFFTGDIAQITNDGTVTEYPVPGGHDPDSLTEGSDGNIWFSEPGANEIGRMTPLGVVTSFPITNRSQDPTPRGVALGPDGNVWFVENTDGYIGSITPAGVVTRFPIPDASPGAWAITTGPDGDLWFTESQADKIGHFDPRSQTFGASLNVPTGESSPWGILSAPDKHIWFTERTGNKIGEVVGSKIREYGIKQPQSYPQALAPGSGHVLWFVEALSGSVGRIDAATGAFGSVIKLPSQSIPEDITSGPNHSVWFTIAAYRKQNKIGAIAAP